MAATRAKPAFQATGFESTTGRLSVAGRDYAVGLTWQLVDNPAKADAEARQAAARPEFDADFYCLRLEGNSQYGLGGKARGHVAGAPALAAHLADSKPGSWIGLFKVPGGFYLLAVRDDTILDHTDVVLAGEGEARQQLDELLNYSQWDARYAPAEFDVDDAEAADLASLLKGKPKAKLRAADRLGKPAKILAFALVALLVVGGFYAWRTYQERQYEEALAAAQAQLQNAGLGTKQIEIPPGPWTGRPVATQWLDSCLEGMKEALAIDFPGWRTIKAACDDGSVHLETERAGSLEEGGGTINWIQATLRRNGGRGSVAMQGGDKASVSFPLRKVAVYPAETKTPEVVHVRRFMLSRMEEKFTRVSFSQPQTAPPAGSNQPPQFYTSLKMQFATPYDPRAYMDEIAAVQGMTFKSVSLDVRTGVYSVDVDAHEFIPPPTGVAGPAGGPPSGVRRP